MDSLDTTDVNWSEGFDAMCSAAHSAVVEIAVGTQAYLALSTSQVCTQSVAMASHCTPATIRLACQWDSQLKL